MSTISLILIVVVIGGIFGEEVLRDILDGRAPHQQDEQGPSIEPMPGDEAPPPRTPGERPLPEVPVEARGNRKVTSFRGAKNMIYDLHAELGLEQTFYCGCAYQDRKPDLRGCGYTVRKREDRAQRTEIEHVMPASRFGHTFPEWTEGHADCVKKGKPYKGRPCAEETSAAFSLMEADLYNLRPAIGEVNGDRLDYEWGDLDGEVREYGTCDVEIRDQIVEPRAAIRGEIARTYLYMAWAYPSRVKLSGEERARFERWDREDPPDEAERRRAARIAELQGNTQPFIAASAR